MTTHGIATGETGLNGSLPTPGTGVCQASPSSVRVLPGMLELPHPHREVPL